MNETSGMTRALRAAAIGVTAFATAGAVGCVLATGALAAGTVEMQRLYNPNSGEHFYTASAVERDHLVSVGWVHEGVGWTAPETSATPVFRLYNANAGDHHYTASSVERDHLVSVGWRDEGVGWYSDDARGVALFRQYNPNAACGSHNYTTSEVERDHLVSVGWNDEGVAWYGVAPGAATDTAPAEPETPAPGDDAQDPSTPTTPSQGGQQGGETRPPATDPEPEAPVTDPTPAACDHQWEDVYRTESYVVSEAYDYQKQVHVADQWQCSCLELFDSPEELGNHQSYYIRVLQQEGHGRSRVVPVYEYETVHVPAVMGERQILLYTECTKCGSRF